jgi:glucose-6-phosphate-specific signal transduction histidine kinase
MREALNNVVKHAGANEVRIGIALAEGELTLRSATTDEVLIPARCRRSPGVTRVGQYAAAHGGGRRRVRNRRRAGRGTRLLFASDLHLMRGNRQMDVSLFLAT